MAAGNHLFAEEMLGRFGAVRFRADVPLAPLTTLKVGGPADWLVESRSSDDMMDALRLAHLHGINVTLLGGGSNVLIGDKGIRGLVIRPRGGQIEQLDSAHVRADAPTTINGLVRWTIHRGIAGIEAWAGTPGTVGGAIYGNAHFGGRLIGDLIESVRLTDRKGEICDRSSDEMEFGYDRSRLQKTDEVVLSAVFRVSTGDPMALREVARQSLAYRKQTQPLETPSAGCIFQNPARAVVPAEIPASAGALVDRAGLKGEARGDARVSTAHANFIVNEGRATAADIRSLIDLCRSRVSATFGVTLLEEIVYLGEF
ncbi:MAG TPA: UDP-N-acetylmuramate dehydrogenase [Vicinamibacterales bacterium]|nr:UDP-N-acetylmuramate dehydrogenase [Vicinamibacterales bacterium]